MPSEKEWTGVLAKMIQQTVDGQISWLPDPSITRENAVGPIYSSGIAGRQVVVYEYRYREYLSSGPPEEQTDVAIEFVDHIGNVEWQWPALPNREDLIDAIRYKKSGADQFLKHFLASSDQR